jgi:alpha-glucosidase
VRWRHQQPALRWGSIRFLETAEPVLAFVREFEGECVLATFNLSRDPMDVDLPEAASAHILDGHGLLQGRLHAGKLRLPPHGLLFASIP